MSINDKDGNIKSQNILYVRGNGYPGDNGYIIDLNSESWKKFIKGRKATDPTEAEHFEAILKFLNNNGVYPKNVEELEQIKKAAVELSKFIYDYVPQQLNDYRALLTKYDNEMLNAMYVLSEETLNSARITDKHKQNVINTIIEACELKNKTFTDNIRFECDKFVRSATNLTTLKGVIEKSLNKYTNISAEEKVDLTDEMFYNMITNLKEVWNNYKEPEMKEVFKTLLTNVGLTPYELVTLSSKCSHLFTKSCEKRITEAERTMQSFKNMIVAKIQLDDIASSNSEELLNRINNYSFKNMLFRCGTIASQPESTLRSMVNLFSGETIENLVANKSLTFTQKKTRELADKYRNFKIDASVNEMEHILFDNLSTLTTTPSAVLNVLDILNTGLKLQNPNHQTSLTLVNAKNITNIPSIPAAYLQVRMKSVLSLLSHIMDYNEIVNYLSQDLSIFTVDSTFIKEKFVECFNNSKIENLNDSLKAMLKAGFHKNMDVNNNKLAFVPERIAKTRVTPSTSAENIKVNVKNMDALLDLLDDFSVSTNNIVLEDNNKNANANSENETKTIISEYKNAETSFDKHFCLTQLMNLVKQDIVNVTDATADLIVPENLHSLTKENLDEQIEAINILFTPTYENLKTHVNWLRFAVDDFNNLENSENNTAAKLSVKKEYKEVEQQIQNINRIVKDINNAYVKSFNESYNAGTQIINNLENKAIISKEDYDKIKTGIDEEKEKLEKLNVEIADETARMNEISQTNKSNLTKGLKLISELIGSNLNIVCKTLQEFIQVSESITYTVDDPIIHLFKNAGFVAMQAKVSETQINSSGGRILKHANTTLEKDKYYLHIGIGDFIENMCASVENGSTKDLIDNIGKIAETENYFRNSNNHNIELNNFKNAVKDLQSTCKELIESYTETRISYGKVLDNINGMQQVINTQKNRVETCSKGIAKCSSILKKCITDTEFAAEANKYNDIKLKLNTAYETLPEDLLDHRKVKLLKDITEKLEESIATYKDLKESNATTSVAKTNKK